MNTESTEQTTSKIITFFKDLFKSKESEPLKIQHYADTVLRNSSGEILLLQRSYNDDFMPGVWCLPGGKVDSGENSTEAAPREVQEETGLEVSCDFIKTYNKEKAIIHYYQALIKNDDELILLDNEEHFRYEWVPFKNLDRYDLIFDLQEILEDLQSALFEIPILLIESKTPEEEIANTPARISKSFDDGLISEDDYLAYHQITSSFEIIKKGFEAGLVSPEKYSEAFEKSKHYEFVNVVRDGKSFMQYREVGTDKVEEHLPVGESIDTGAELGLYIKKYSEKSFLICGDTYKNLELLRKIKEDAGIGNWNKALNGWIFPLSAKASILANLAGKMEIGTYDETVAQEAAINLKNSLDIGTAVSIDGEETLITEVTTNDTGEVEYKVADTPDLTDTTTVTETEIAIPPASEEKAEELINNATEENRMQTGKELFGKEAGEVPASEEIELKGQEDVKIEVKEFTTRSGEVVSALDFMNVNQMDIQLSNQDDILEKPKPYYIPDVNEYRLENSNQFVFDYVRNKDGTFLVNLNGYAKDGTIMNIDPRYKVVDPAYAVMSLDNLVAMTEYYKLKRKAQYKKKADDHNNEITGKYLKLTSEQIERYRPFDYTRLSAVQKKKISKEEWIALSQEDKMKWVPGMTSPVYAKKHPSRIDVQEDDQMRRSNFNIYKQFVNKEYQSPFDLGKRHFDSSDECAKEFGEAREQIKWKAVDLKIQKEDNEGSYQKGRETSYGDSNTKDDLLESHGVKVKSQNGKEISIDQVNQIKENLSLVYQSFGDRKSMSKAFGLKISHSGEKLMHARNALGLYNPGMKAIGVSNNLEAGKFGFTLAHEYAHFIDNYTGSKDSNKRHYASDDFNSTAGEIASAFRKNMNKKSDSDYINRTCENFARAFEQYHAMKHEGEDAVKYKSVGVAYHQDENHVSKEKFNTLIKPLIEKFLSENDHILKSAFDELNIIDINNNFELIKAGFDNGLVEEDKYLDYAIKYNEIVKGDPTHGGKLVKKIGKDSKGHKTTKWVKQGEEDKDEKSKPLEFTDHSKDVLAAFAKEAPESELKKIINTSHDEKLRKAAHLELDRRGKKEKPQDDKAKTNKTVSNKVVTKKAESKKKETPKLAEKANTMLKVGDNTEVGMIEDVYGDQYQINGRWYHKNIVKPIELNEEGKDQQKIQSAIQKLIIERGTGTITLYHGTDNESYDKIHSDGKFGGEGISFLTHKAGEAKEYGDNKSKYRGKKEGKVIAMTLPKWAVQKNKATGEYETEFQLENKDGVWTPTSKSIKKEYLENK